MAKHSSRRFRIEHAVTETDLALFVVGLDRRVLFFNPACVALTGWEAADVIGQVCHFASSVERTQISSLTDALCPPIEAFAGEYWHVPKHYVHRESGLTVARLVHYFPIREAAAMTGVLGLITELPKPKAPPEPSVITQVHAELAALRHEVRQNYGVKSLIGRSLSMQRVFSQINAARSCLVPVAISGEAGTGKEQVARAIHYESEFGAKSFVPLDCKRLPPTEIRDAIGRLIESDWSEMTPILAMHPGCVFLKEVDCLPREIQQRLLNFLKSDQGAAFRTRARLVVSVESGLGAARREERLLDDLFYFVSGLTIELPPLRSRLSDLRWLAQHFLEECNRTRDNQVTTITNDVWPQLEAYNWPGNLDELRQVIATAHASVEPGQALTSAQLPFGFRTGLDAQSLSPTHAAVLPPLEEILRRTEYEHLQAAIEQARGNKTKAAKLLGISRQSLLHRLEQFGIKLEGADE